MNIEQIKKMVSSDAYSFLKTNQHLGENILLFSKSSLPIGDRYK